MPIGMIPLSEMSSPTAGGAIGSAAARLFAEEGRRLADNIEQIATKAEAQAKAPALMAAYAKGLTAVSQGDMSGFGLLAGAEAESAGNPFLMSMTKNAASEGARIAQSYIQSTRVLNKQDDMLERQMENQRAMGDRQSLDDWRSRDAAIEAEEIKQQKAWEENEAGRQRQAQIEGTEYIASPKPAPIPRPPKPTLISKSFGDMQGDLPENKQPFDTGLMPDDAVDESKMNPLPGAPGYDQRVQQGLQTGDEIVNEANASQGPVESVINGPEKTPVPTAPPARDETLVNENWPAAPQEGVQVGVNRPPEVRGQHIVLPVGIMNVKIQTDKAKAMKVVETVKTATGSKTYTIGGADKGEDPADKVINGISGITAQDYDFSEWIAKQIADGKQITVEQTPGSEKGSAWFAKSNGEPYGMKNPAAAEDPSQPESVARPISESIAKLWVDVQQNLPKLKGRVQFEFPPTKEKVDRMNQIQIQKINDGKATIADVNRERKKFGFAELSEKDLTSGKKEPIASADPEIEAELEKKGVKHPDKKDAPKPPEDKTPRDVIRDLEAQFKKLKTELPKNPSVYNRLVDVQKQINAIKKQQADSFNDMVREGMTGVN